MIDAFARMHELRKRLARLDDDDLRVLITAYDELARSVEFDGGAGLFDSEVDVERVRRAYEALRSILGIKGPMARREFWSRCESLGLHLPWRTGSENASPPPSLLKRLIEIAGSPADDCARLMREDGLVSFEVVERERVEREVPAGTYLGFLGTTNTWCYYLGSRRALVVTVKETGEETDVGDWWSWLHAAPWFDGTLEVKVHNWSFSLPERKYSGVNFHEMEATTARVLNALGLEDLPAVELRPDVLRDLKARAKEKPRQEGPYR